MSTVDDVITEKGGLVYTIPVGATVYEAIQRMSECEVGALIVVGEGAESPTAPNAAVGLITERDYLRKVALRGRTSRTTLVREIMSSPLISVTRERGVRACLRMMNRHRIRHLPVIENRSLGGLVSMGDLVRRLVVDQRSEIHDLMDYMREAATPVAHGRDSVP